jgi:ketosteroid isomerase-like protein
MVDIEVEKQKIRDLNQLWFRYENEKKTDEICDQLMADDFILQAPGMAQLVGKEANYPFLKAFYDDVLISSKGGPMIIEVAESGDLAYDLGTTIAKLNGPDGPFEDHQKYLFVWKKIQGKWKTVAGHFSSDLPP